MIPYLNQLGRDVNSMAAYERQRVPGNRGSSPSARDVAGDGVVQKHFSPSAAAAELLQSASDWHSLPQEVRLDWIEALDCILGGTAALSCSGTGPRNLVGHREVQNVLRSRPQSPDGLLPA